MKNIILIRHAKSDWNNENLTDFERPLNSRGLRDAEFMSSKLAHKGLHIDCIISNSAVRALTTSHFFLLFNIDFYMELQNHNMLKSFKNSMIRFMILFL